MFLLPASGALTKALHFHVCAACVAKLDIASAAPAAATAARAPVLEPVDDLISLGDAAPSQAPMFLDLDGEPAAPMRLDEPTPDLPSTGPSPMDALAALSGDVKASSEPDAIDLFAAAAQAPVEEEPHKPTSATPNSMSQLAAALPSVPAADVQGSDLHPVVIVGPSGVGKATLVSRFMARHGRHFGFTVSHTTREPRPGEHDGKDHHFVTRQQMQEAISEGQFLEHAEVHGSLYGTSIAAVRAVKGEGKTAILEIDVQVRSAFVNFSSEPLQWCQAPFSSPQ